MGVVSRRWVWLMGVGGIYGRGCKEVYRFPHTTYPYSSCRGGNIGEGRGGLSPPNIFDGEAKPPY